MAIDTDLATSETTRSFLVKGQHPRRDHFSPIADSPTSHEERLEREALSTAQAVICVAPRDLNVRKRLAGGRNISFHTLRNGVEIPDAPKHNHSRNPKTIQLLFAGWIYPPGQALLVSFLEKLGGKHRTSLTIAGNWPPELIRQIREGVEGVELGYLPHKSIEKLLRTHDFALSFVASEVSCAINTKILEAAAQRTSVVVLSGPGEVADFVRDNRLAVIVDPEDIQRGVEEVMGWWESERDPGPWTTFEAHHDLDRLPKKCSRSLSVSPRKGDSTRCS